MAGDNTISQVIHMVEEAQAKQAPSQQLVDRFARWYTPGILAAMLVAVVPYWGLISRFISGSIRLWLAAGGLSLCPGYFYPGLYRVGHWQCGA